LTASSLFKIETDKGGIGKVQRILILLAALTLTATLLVGGLGSALAADSDECRGLFGTVVSVDIDDQGFGTISLENVKCVEGTDTLTVTCDNSTTYHVPTFTPPWQTWTQWAESQVNLEGYLMPETGNGRIAVLLTEPLTGETVEPVANKIMIIPQKAMYQPQYRHQLCVLAGIDGNMARVINRNGQEVTVELPEGTELAEGQLMIMVTNRFNNGVQFRLVAANKAGDLFARFRNQLQVAETEEVANQIGAIAETAYQRQMNTLECLQIRLQEQNREQLAAAVGQAIDDAECHYQQTLQLQEQICSRVRISSNGECPQN
jgi:hypothetical protein